MESPPLYFNDSTNVSDAVLNVIAHLPTEFLSSVASPVFFKKLDDSQFMRVATLLAHKSYREGGCPIGAVLVDGVSLEILGKGHNLLVQQNDSTTHGETAALRDAGRVAALKKQGPLDFRRTWLYTTLTPCAVCCAQITHRIHCARVIIGDITNAPSSEKTLREGGIPEVVIREDAEAIALYKTYAVQRPELHLRDWKGSGES